MIVAFVPDLMDRSKIAAAAPGAVFVAHPEQLAAVAAEAGATRVVIDLSRAGALDAVAGLVGSGVAVVGFGSHVDRDMLERARAVGCDRVLARSAFFSRLPAALAD